MASRKSPPPPLVYSPREVAIAAECKRWALAWRGERVTINTYGGALGTAVERDPDGVLRALDALDAQALDADDDS
jgi:hypothetical protein